MYRYLILAAIAFTGLAQRPLTMDQIVLRHEQALGGIDRIHALDSLVLRGMYHEGGPIPPDMPVVARNYNAFKATILPGDRRSGRSQSGPKGGF